MYRTVWVMATIAVLVVALPSAAGAQEATLEPATGSIASEPELVADGKFFGIDLALDAEGNRHIAASQVFRDSQDPDDPHEDLRRDLWYGTDRDGTWSAQKILEGDARTTIGWTDPSIAVDADGTVHIAVVRDHVASTPGQTEGIFYLTDKDRAPGDFGEPVRVARPDMDEPSLAVVDGTRYLVYAKLSRLGEPIPPAPAFVKTDLSGSWVTHRLGDFGSAPVLRVDPDGRAHIVYQGVTDDGRGAFLSYVTVDPETGEPTKSRRIPATDDVWYRSELALDPSGRPHVAWETEKDILWTRRTADGWSQPESLGVRRSDWQSLVVDPIGQPHVVFAGRAGGDIGGGIIHAQRGAGTWPQSVVVEGVGWTQVTSETLGQDVSIVWAPVDRGEGLWVYGPIPTVDPDAADAHTALEDLLDVVPYDKCVPFTEQGPHDPFSYGAQAAIHCAKPARGVRQAALFGFPDIGSMSDYWEWRVRQIEPAPPAREGACADGRKGLTTWQHGELACYVSKTSKEAKMRWTDERTGVYGILDATDRNIARLHAVWTTLTTEGEG